MDKAKKELERVKRVSEEILRELDGKRMTPRQAAEKVRAISEKHGFKYHGPGDEGEYSWPRPRRMSIYIFDAQLKILRQIAEEKGVRLRHVFFECFQFYIGTYLQQKREQDNAGQR